MPRKKKTTKITQEDCKVTVKEVLAEIDDKPTEFLDMPKIPPDEIQLELPYATNDQNIIWYIKQAGKTINLSDLKISQPWLKSFESFKKAIDKI